jgi:pyruvate/2-oxoacid:ferredoxin oxidoreductase beta subunit
MLGEHAFGYVGGAGSCAGCGEATAIRMMVAATRQVYGPDSMGIVAATGCNSVFGSTYPFNPYLVPWTNSLFENSPAVALGIRAGWDQAGHPDRRLWVMGGDGAMYDIGFQALSRMVASGADIKVLVLDTQVYSNTGGQASTASFGGQVTKLSAFGSPVCPSMGSRTTPRAGRPVWPSIRGRSRCSPTTRGEASASLTACRSRETRRPETTGRGRPTASRSTS